MIQPSLQIYFTEEVTWTFAVHRVVLGANANCFTEEQSLNWIHCCKQGCFHHQCKLFHWTTVTYLNPLLQTLLFSNGPFFLFSPPTQTVSLQNSHLIESTAVSVFLSESLSVVTSGVPSACCPYTQFGFRAFFNTAPKLWHALTLWNALPFWNALPALECPT